MMLKLLLPFLDGRSRMVNLLMYSRMFGCCISVLADGLRLLTQGSYDMTMDKFIMEGAWNKDELRNYFGEELVMLISEIQIFPELAKDQVELIYKSSRKSISALAFESSVHHLNEIFLLESN
ncbi:hypothetical protein KFK09_012156 [Dendrobium nobile]|uniref:Uncharacterized protein n=1 Tax=Dendrobium nobile TaxID=94219 RepID=A0A8T3BEQ8_DENNO|nr:hypothetical protein KFK09_012156 [Dendrobium nobile]